MKQPVRRSKAPAPIAEPWKPTPFDDADAYAIQALAHGKPSEDQAKRALDFIINSICATYDQSYRPASARDSDFAEGKRYVGLTLVKMLKWRPPSA